MAKPQFAVIECERPKVRLWCKFADFLSDNRTVIIVSTGQVEKPARVSLSDAETGKMLKWVEALPYSPRHFHAWLHPDRSSLLVSYGRTFRVDARTLKCEPVFEVETSQASFSKDGQLMAVVGDDKNIRVLEIKGGAELASLQVDSWSECLAFRDGEPELLVVQGMGPALLWNFRTGKKAECKKSSGCNVALSRDGSMLVASLGKGLGKKGWTIEKTDTKSWKSEKFDFPGDVRDCAISPDGTRLAIAAYKELVILDLSDGRPWLKWKKPHYSNVSFARFAPDGQRLACILDSELHLLDFRAGAKAQPAATAPLKPGQHRCVEMVGPDDVMDRESGHFEPLNPLPVKCPACKMVDLDFVAKPYYLGKRIESPVDLAPAMAGNFLVRESMKRLLEVAAPGQCDFYPTAHRKTKQPTPWFLAVPRNFETTDTPLPQACPKCGEPWDYVWQDKDALANPVSKHDIFKSRNWSAHTGDFPGWDKGRQEGFRQHISRDLFFSLRLEALVKKLGLRGMVRSSDSKQTASSEELAWAEEKAALLKPTGSTPRRAGKGDVVERWFEDYLKRNSKQKTAVPDFAAFEKKHRVKLPPSYKEFIVKLGPRTFKDVDEVEGFCAHILPPKRLEFHRCASRGEEEAAFDGVVFASTDHGDVFCFRLAGRGSEFEVCKYDHEMDSFEPYTWNFAECIKRFVGE